MAIFGARQSAAVAPSYIGLQIQTATNALPIPIVYGVANVAPNVIWYSDFTTVPETTSSGKGGSTSTVTGYDYSAAIILALCEGPITSVDTVWKGQSVTDLVTLGLSLVNGATPQAPWSYLATAHPDQALGYPGTAYVCSPSYDLGSSATVDNHNFEVEGILAGSGFNGVDADPASIVSDFLINAQYGVGFPGAAINATTLFGSDGDASYETYCRAVGLALSPALTNQESANSILTRWLQLTNTAAVWSGGQLKFVPYGDAAAAGNGITWNPNVTPVYNLTDDDFQGNGGDDPLKASRSDPYAVPNVQRLEIEDRANAYNATPIEARDQAMIEAFGLRVGTSITAHEICDANIGAIAAQLILQRGLYVRVTYAWKLSWEYCLLEPMDLVTITDASLGLSNAAVRITSVAEDDEGILSFTAEEFPLGAATAVQYPTRSASGTRINREAPAGPVNPPIIFEPPGGLTNGLAQVWAVVSGGDGSTADPNWGGANVWLSTDGATYQQVGRVDAPARQGFATGAMPAFSGPNPDASDVLAVDLTESGGVMVSSSGAAAANGLTLCRVDGELLAFTTATLTGRHKYSLGGLYRGLYGTVASAHAAGAPFGRLDAAVFSYAIPAAFIGQTIHLKFQSFNVFQGGVQDLSTCTAYTYKPVGSGVIGPVTQSLAIGTALDFDLASHSVTETDDWGPASDANTTIIDLGVASS